MMSGDEPSLATTRVLFSAQQTGERQRAAFIKTLPEHTHYWVDLMLKTLRTWRAYEDYKALPDDAVIARKGYEDVFRTRGFTTSDAVPEALAPILCKVMHELKQLGITEHFANNDKLTPVQTVWLEDFKQYVRKPYFEAMKLLRAQAPAEYAKLAAYRPGGMIRMIMGELKHNMFLLADNLHKPGKQKALNDALDIASLKHRMIFNDAATCEIVGTFKTIGAFIPSERIAAHNLLMPAALKTIYQGALRLMFKSPEELTQQEREFLFTECMHAMESVYQIKGGIDIVFTTDATRPTAAGARVGKNPETGRFFLEMVNIQLCSARLICTFAFHEGTHWLQRYIEANPDYKLPTTIEGAQPREAAVTGAQALSPSTLKRTVAGDTVAKHLGNRDVAVAHFGETVGENFYKAEMYEREAVCIENFFMALYWQRLAHNAPDHKELFAIADTNFKHFLKQAEAAITPDVNDKDYMPTNSQTDRLATLIVATHWGGPEKVRTAPNRHQRKRQRRLTPA